MKPYIFCSPVYNPDSMPDTRCERNTTGRLNCSNLAPTTFLETFVNTTNTFSDDGGAKTGADIRAPLILMKTSSCCLPQ